MDQILMLVDAADNLIGYAPRDECHRGQGRLHRAIAIILVNRRGEILLQRRRNRLWDGCWDITGATHPRHVGGRDEDYGEAGERCLRDEWGIAAKLRPAIDFVYFAPHGEDCEHERCVLLVGGYDGTITHAPEHGYDSRWLALGDLAAEIGREPDSFTPWARIAVERLKTDPESISRARAEAGGDSPDR